MRPMFKTSQYIFSGPHTLRRRGDPITNRFTGDRPAARGLVFFLLCLGDRARGFDADADLALLPPACLESSCLG